MNRPRLTEQTRATVNTIATWAGALVAFGLLVYGIVAVVVNRVSGQTITEFCIGAVLIVWLLWLTLTVAGHHERLDVLADDEDRAIGMVQNHTHADADTDTIPVVVHDLPRRRPRPYPVDDVDEQLKRFNFGAGGRA